jgi:hypothetical protein
MLTPLTRQLVECSFASVPDVMITNIEGTM